MFSIYTVASMLPCGRYYYEPEGGYVGNPWVKVSFQYLFLYLGWIIHNLDLVEHYAFNFIQTVNRQCTKLYDRAKLKSRSSLVVYNQMNDQKSKTTIRFENTNYNLNIFN
jgi:hypothetical protein